jgi:hypothetical protein
MRYLIPVWVIFVLLTGCKDDWDDQDLVVGVEFTSILETSKSIFIEGTEEQPVFTFGNPVLMDSYFFFPDRVSSFVYKYSSEGTFLDSFGGRGQGPGDLTDPLNVYLTNRNTLLVNELGNLRLQEFDLHGNSLSLIAVPSYPFSVFPDEDLENLVWCIFPLVTEDGSKLLHLVDIQDGHISKSLSPYEERSVVTHGWVAEMAGERIYIANILDREIKVYDLKDTEFVVQRIDINSPEVRFFDTKRRLNQPETRESLMETLTRLREEDYTSIDKILRFKEWLIVVHRRHNMLDHQNDFFLDVFDDSGRLHYSGINITGRLISLNNGGQFAVIEKSEDNFGTINIDLVNFKI